MKTGAPLRIFTVVLAALALACSAGVAVKEHSDVQDLKAQVEQAQAANDGSSVDELRSELEQVQSDLDDTKQTADQASSDLDDLKTQLNVP